MKHPVQHQPQTLEREVVFSLRLLGRSEGASWRPDSARLARLSRCHESPAPWLEAQLRLPTAFPCFSLSPASACASDPSRAQRASSRSWPAQPSMPSSLASLAPWSPSWPPSALTCGSSSFPSASPLPFLSAPGELLLKPPATPSPSSSPLRQPSSLPQRPRRRSSSLAGAPAPSDCPPYAAPESSPSFRYHLGRQMPCGSRLQPPLLRVLQPSAFRPQPPREQPLPPPSGRPG
mmetsp:Transcript_64296/g.153502  ORF Transcript_64296/g.153502 Transcript_64296/m.153502 type:complete len:234 (-) Transcript_64296:550-1251(-)